MPKISLADFVDIVSKSGTPKATKVAQVKNRPPYNPATDFYKQLRDKIIDTHLNNRDKQYLIDSIEALPNLKKAAHYQAILNGYTTWWGKKKLEWFSPPSDVFSYNNIDVNVNPELGIISNGHPYIIKLYLKADPLTKNRIDIVTYLMEVCLRQHCSSKEIMAIFDVRNSKLITSSVIISSLNATLKAELAYIEALWPNV